MTGDASPLARRIARLSGVDLDTVTAVDANGRVRARDVLAALSTSPEGDGAAERGADTGVEGADGMIWLEASCRARPLFDLADRLGGASAATAFEHAVLFIVARALACVPGLVPAPDREGGPAGSTVRLGLFAGEAQQATLTWNTGIRRIRPISRAISELESVSGPKSATNGGGNAPHVLVRFSATPGIRDRSVSAAGLRIPVLVVRYSEPAGSADLTLTWQRRFADGAAAGEFVSEIKRLIEEPRRLLL